jgi:hypothetical protein
MHFFLWVFAELTDWGNRLLIVIPLMFTSLDYRAGLAQTRACLGGGTRLDLAKMLLRSRRGSLESWVQERLLRQELRVNVVELPQQRRNSG